MEMLLTKTECKQILATVGKNNFQIKNYKIKPAVEAIGFLGEYYRLIINCTESQLISKQMQIEHLELNFFIKSIPRAGLDQEKSKIFLKETRLYATLLKDLQTYSTTVFGPKAFYTRPDLIVMEDFVDLDYEKCQNGQETLTIDEMESLLRTLAIFHAASLIHETCKGLKLNELYPCDLFEEISVAPHIPWFTTGLKAILNLSQQHPHFQSSDMQDFICKQLPEILETVCEMQKPSEKYCNVLCHRDLWLSNVLFNKQNSQTKAVFVDFQTSCYCPPAIDVIFALFLNLESGQRKLKKLDFLKFYYKELTMELAKHELKVERYMSFENFLSSYNEFEIFGYLYHSIATTLIYVPAELVTNEFKNVDRTSVLLDYMNSNVKFKARMESSIGELLNFVVRNYKT